MLLAQTLLASFIVHAVVAASPPVVEVRTDNTVVTQSCTIRIAPDVVIPDTDGNGVIQIVGDDIVVEFEAGSVLRGADVGDGAGKTPWDRLAGIGVSVVRGSGVTLRGLRVRGFKVGVAAAGTPGLTVEDGDFADNFRQRLNSMPLAEDASDWLWPHENDEGQWRSRYGAAILVERSSDVTIRRNRVRTGQNGIMLDRVIRARVYDNDASFLSGWGLSMWRSSDNIISRNALDFCVRGHSEGVYNRGQDSAGILAFESCQRNTFAENSATHSGDGFFGFAGKEALGERPPAEPSFDLTAAGCTANIFYGNDFSYAPAHGLELTFSDAALVWGNRIVENAICGIWGGYSNDWTITENLFERNGQLGYGHERGAINIEHGSGHRIFSNSFIDNRVALHLWWDDDTALLALPGVKAHYRGVTDNEFLCNLVRMSTDAGAFAVQIRSPRPDMLGTLAHGGNRVEIAAGSEWSLPAGFTPEVRAMGPQECGIGLRMPPPEIVGSTRPVGARAHLRGRDKIIMGPWGPWDHESAMIRLRGRLPGLVRYELFGDIGVPRSIEPRDSAVSVNLWRRDGFRELDIVASAPGVHPYRVELRPGADRVTRVVEGTFIATTWDVRLFPMSVDPLAPGTLEAWRAESMGEHAARISTEAIDFTFGSAGPAGVAALRSATGKLPGRARFGLVARTRLALPAGRWKLTTLSDDGVRVRVNGATIIENWTHHGPTTDTGIFEQSAASETEIEVEYFQLDGHAVLRFFIERQ